MIFSLCCSVNTNGTEGMKRILPIAQYVKKSGLELIRFDKFTALSLPKGGRNTCPMDPVENRQVKFTHKLGLLPNSHIFESSNIISVNV